MKRYITSIATGLFLLAAFLPSTSAHAQLQEVQQTVFGMDCAPCAYAMENRLKAFEGVQEVSVSLSDAMATLQLAPENELTLKKIRTAVRKGGFSAEEATITVIGTLEKEDGQWVLTSAAGKRFRLEQTAGNLSEQVNTDEQVTVTGTVPEGEKPASGWKLQVKALQATA